ncbi:hypothetical protein NLG97_g742 [Lecanicillium saksenae]|uniref:Uncharacterized protein n=1 Tax=Lecanicillium saksenae TaxID=468837 RepID=A0ACC1R5X5_9HYPO|nr:hypothetical protein NLG97_g742 [Lecanicillium saksenae]
MKVVGDAHGAWDLPHVQNFTDTWHALQAYNTSVIGNASLTQTYNITHLRLETPGDDDNEPGFVSVETLKYLIASGLVAGVSYYWNIFLERRLPMRKHGSSSTNVESKNERAAAAMMAAEENEQFEEGIVKKWIAIGKFKRSSLNITNTVAKWLLDVSIGRALVQLTDRLTHDVLGLKRPSEVMARIPLGVFQDTLAYAITPNTVASLLGMALFPAAWRALFAAAFATLFSIFFNALMCLVLPQFLASSLGKAVIGNLLDSEWSTQRDRRLLELSASQ